jgi:hypothetical protein
MKKLLFILLLVSGVARAQFPIFDHFTAIGGANQWFIAFGGGTMGVDGGTNLCYNVGGNYANGVNYSFQSPNYPTTFSGCDDITITFSTSFNKRAGDDFLFFYIDGGVWSIGTPIVNGLNTITLPNTVTDFSIDFYANGSGSRAGKFAHIDWFNIACNTSLPIELLSFTGEVNGKSNILKWITATEINNDYFTVERSEDAITFNEVGKVDGAGNSLSTKQYSMLDNKPYKTITYYRLVQTDYDGKYKSFDIIAVTRAGGDDDLKVIGIYNMMGQEVTEDYDGIKVYYFSNGSIIKKYKIIER